MKSNKALVVLLLGGLFSFAGPAMARHFPTASAMGAAQNYSLPTFKVSIDGMPKVSFSQIGGMGIDFEDVQCENKTSCPLKSKKGRCKVRDVYLTRMYTGDRSLFDWVQSEKNAKKAKEKEALVEILDPDGKKLATYKLHGVWVKSYGLPQFRNDGEYGYGRGGDYEELVLSVADIEAVK